MKNSIGIGADIEDVKRFKSLDRKENMRFFEKVYTSKEITYCYSKKNPEQHLAARFAGKEAVVKALMSVGIKSAAYCDIEIANATDGVPKIMLKRRDVDARVSLSHSGDRALAFAVVVKKWKK